MIHALRLGDATMWQDTEPSLLGVTRDVLTVTWPAGQVKPVMATCRHGYLLSWLLVVMANCRHGYLPSWLLVVMATCRHGYLSSWLLDIMATCRHGYLSSWLLVVMATCRHGYLSSWLLVVMATCRHYYLSSWLLLAIDDNENCNINQIKTMQVQRLTFSMKATKKSSPYVYET